MEEDPSARLSPASGHFEVSALCPYLVPWVQHLWEPGVLTLLRDEKADSGAGLYSRLPRQADRWPSKDVPVLIPMAWDISCSKGHGGRRRN